MACWENGGEPVSADNWYGLVCTEMKKQVAKGENEVKMILKNGRHQNMFEFKGEGLSGEG